MGGRVRWTPKNNALRAPFAAELEQGSARVLFVGRELDSHALLNLLLEARTPLREMQPLKEVETLKNDEITKVNKTKQTEPCPPGTYFTGTHWVNFYGEPTFEHPCLQEFLAEYVVETNKEAVAHNAVVEKEWTDAAALVTASYVERNGVREPITPPPQSLSPGQNVSSVSIA